jgi:RNA polymerase sigma factor for flagellar operon FliA
MITSEHLALARRVARRFLRALPAGVDVDDLTQVALISVQDALSRFDPARGVPMAAFLVRCMRTAMLDEVRRYDWMSRSARRQHRVIHAATSRLEHTLGRRPRASEVAQALNMSLESYHACMRDALPPEADDVDEIDPAAVVESRQKQVAFGRALSRLPERQRRVVVARCFEGVPRDTVAVMLGISGARVSQLFSAAIGALRLRQNLAD